MAFHRILERQLRRSTDKASGQVDMDRLLQQIDEIYHHNDEERRKIERSMSLMSDELLEINRKVRSDADLEVRTANQRFELAVSGANDGIWDWDLAAEEIYYSPTWFDILGFNAQELPNTLDTWYQQVHPDDLDDLKKNLNTFIQGLENKGDHEYRMLKKDGRSIWVQTKWTGVRSEEGVLTRLVGISSNTTKKKETEERLIEAKEKAEEASKMKSDFLASMSHEIRTPMNGVVGVLNLLFDTPLNKEQKDLCQTMKESGKLLLKIIDDILDFSKMDSGEVQIEALDFSVTQLFKSVEAGLSILAQEKGLTLSFHRDSSVPDCVRSDPTRLQQILFNLIGNALKFTQKGGVTVRVKPLDAEKSLFRFEVSDTGIGIPENKIESLFDPFTQANSSTNRQYGGTGLGLSICRKLSELMGEGVGVKSELGKGSTFYFDVYLKDAQGLCEIPQEEAPQGADESAKKLSILVAEDNAVNQFLIKALLKKEGHTVDIANDGVEALEKLQAPSASYDLIFLDIHMPKLDGVETAIQVRKLKNECANLPIIALTANVLPEHRALYLKSGMNDFLSKPIDEALLLAALKKWGSTGVKKRRA